MRIIFNILLILFSLSSLSQSYSSTGFLVKANFELSETARYEVSEFLKVDNIFLGFRSEIKSTVSFEVIDTANGGYWISYTVNTNSVKQHKDSSVYFMAALQDGIQLFVYAKNGHLSMDSATYFTTKKRIATALDSLAIQQTFGKKNTQYIQYLQTELKEDAGLGSLVAPLMIFKTYYESEVYKKFRLTSIGGAENILEKPLFSGNIERELEKTPKDGSVQLNYLFTGHSIYAAQYYKSKYEAMLAMNNIKRGRFFYPPEMKYVSDYTFRTQPGKSFPSYLYKKNVSEYIMRSVSKVTMEAISNEE